MALCAAPTRLGLGQRPSLARRPAARVVCQAVPEATAESKIAKQAAAAGVVASALLAVNAVVPEASIAARSGGRVGSSAGFAARRTTGTSTGMGTRTKATATASPSTTVVHHHTTVVAPSPFGFGMPFGGFGWGGGMMYRPAFLMPFPFLGGLFTFMFGMILAGVVFAVVKAAISATSKPKKSSQDWDSL